MVGHSKRWVRVKVGVKSRWGKIGAPFHRDGLTLPQYEVCHRMVVCVPVCILPELQNTDICVTCHYSLVTNSGNKIHTAVT